MYLRFVIGKKDESSGCRQGVFVAAAELRDSGELYDYQEERLKEVLSWFKKNLKIPKKFSRATSHNTLPKAISWYKDTAKECLSRMHDLKAILESHDVKVDIIQTDSPGYIVYEDEHQVTAEPFKSTRA